MREEHDQVRVCRGIAEINVTKPGLRVEKKGGTHVIGHVRGSSHVAKALSTKYKH